MQNLFRAIPSVDASLAALHRADAALADSQQTPHALLRDLEAAFWENKRESIRAGACKDADSLRLEHQLPALLEFVQRGLRPRFRSALNATGVVVHTNMGRSVLAEEARQAVVQAAADGELQALSGGADLLGAEAAQTTVPLVLVVDDSITVRRVTQRLLVREGFRVTLAADGLQALEKLQDERPAVVLSDIEMPRMDGFDLVRNIRADVRLADLPVIMITSRIAEKHREHARQLGVDHYLGKPYSDEELLGLIRHYALQRSGPAPERSPLGGPAEEPGVAVE